MSIPRGNAAIDQNWKPTLIGVSTVDGQTPVAVEVDPVTGLLQVSSSGGGGAATIADGADIAQGAAADAAVPAGNTGTISGKLRQISLDISAGNTAQTNGSQQTKLTDGANTANVLKSDGTAAGQNALKIASAYQEFTGLSGAALNADLLPATDVSGYRWVSIQIAGTYVGVVSFQASNDGITWFATALNGISTASSGGQLGAAFNATQSGGTGMFAGPINARYFRVRMTVYTSGTATATIELFTAPSTIILPTQLAIQSGAWSVGASSATGSATPANAFYMGANDGTNLAALQVRAPGDGFNNISGTLVVFAENALHNGTQWDRERSNESATLLASAARTTTQTSADLTNFNGASFLDVILDVTAVATSSLTLSVDAKDPASGKYYNLITGAAVTAISTNVYRVGVGLTAVANAVANLPVPRTFRIVVTAGNANSTSYSVGYNLTRG